MRRGFTWIRTLWIALFLAAVVPARAVVSLRLPPTTLIEGMAIGAATRSYEPASLLESLEEIRKAGVVVVEIHAGQTLQTNLVDALVGEGLTEEQTLQLRRTAAGTGMRLVAARVRFGNSANAISRVFQWADRLGVQVLVGDPPIEQYDYLERMVRQYNIAVGIANATGRGASSRSGWTDPKAILGRLRGRDTRLGVVVNVLSLVRAGVDPFEAMTELRTRLVGVQVVDLSDFSAQARAVPFGTGKFDFKRFLGILTAQRFGGYVVFDVPSEVPEFKKDVTRGMEFLRAEADAVRKANQLRMAARGATVPEGLTYEVLVQGDIPEPVRVAACPDGSVWFASRRGGIWAWSPETRTNLLVARLPVSNAGQRGLYGFEFDAGFLTNGHVYVYRAPILASGDSNRVSRFTATGGRGAWRIATETERVLLDIPSASHGLQQGGGFLRHPVDGHLYIGTGDNLLPGETPRVYDDPKVAPQNLSDLRGKILRIAVDGSIPKDNPFVTTREARPEVFALGLRNPYSMTFQPDLGNVFAGDVGYDRLQDWEEVNLIRPGANYGWPRCDGRGRDTLSGTACPLPDAVAPWFSYRHDSAAAVMVGPVLGRPPKGWPATFQNGMLISDYSRRTIRFAQMDPAHNAVANSVPFVSGLDGGVLSMALTESGELFMVEYAGNISGGPEDRLSRIYPTRK